MNQNCSTNSDFFNSQIHQKCPNRKGSEIIMHRFTEQFANYCKHNLVLRESAITNYQSLPVCLIDCIYSLRTKYYSVPVPIVNRYADRYMDGNVESSEDTITNLIKRIEDCGGPQEFADSVLKNHQELGGKAHIPKENALLQLATYLSLLHIEALNYRNCLRLLSEQLKEWAMQGQTICLCLLVIPIDANQMCIYIIVSEMPAVKM